MGNTYFYNSTAQFIYTAEELGTAKTINSVAFYHNAQTLVGTLKIYLFHTTESTVNTSSYVTSGTPNYTGTNITLGGSSAGWQEFTLETPFDYNGTDNLLVVVCRTKRSDATSDAYKTSLAWQYTSTSENYRYMMRSNDTESNVALSNTTTSYVQSYYRPNIQIGYELPSSCEKPATLVADPVTHNSATLTWSGGSGTYNVEVKGGEWTDWTEIFHETALTTTNLNDLTIVTDYQARVRSVCTGENSGWKTTSFTTECGPVGIGYECGFEGPNTVGAGSYKLPTCWSRPVGTSTSYPGANSSYGHNSSSHSLYFYGTATSTLQIAVLPEIDGGVNGKRLALYARNPSYYYNASFVVGYMTDPTDASTFTQVGDPISLSSSTSYGSEPYEFDFDNITDNPQYIAIKSTSTSSSSYFVIDDVELKAIPTCLRPTMVTLATDIAATTAKVSWTPNGTNQDHWDVYYCTSPYTAPTATTEPSVVNTADNPCTLSDLQPSTPYRVWVRGNCGSGDVSEWSTNYCSFTTPAYCADMQVQYSTITATATAYNAATVTWTAAGGATQWKVQCSQDNTFATVNNDAVVDEPTASFTDLTAEQTYYVRIAPYCDENDDFNPWSTTKSFTTPESCPAPVLSEAANTTAHGATISWTGSSASYDVKAAEVTVNTAFSTDFEDNQISTEFTNSTTYPWTITDADKHAGTYAIKSGGAGTNYAQSDLTLELNLTDAATVSFWYKASSESGYDYGRFLINGTQKFQTSGTTNSWTQYTFDLTAGTNTLVWRYYKDSGTDKGDDCFYIDDLTITSSSVGTWQPVATGITTNTYVMDDDNIFHSETPYQVKLVGHCPWTDEETASNIVSFTTAADCQTPDGLVPSNVTAHSATISWDAHGQSEFNLQYSTDGENWDLVEGIGEDHYTIDGDLEDNTEYQVQVQATCNTDEWSDAITIKTPCDPIDLSVVDYSDDFESYSATAYDVAGVKPDCWDRIGTGTTAAYAPHVSTEYATTGNGLIFTSGSATYGGNNYAILPAFQQNISDLQINFNYKFEGNYGTFTLGYITDINDANTYHPLKEIARATSATPFVYYFKNDVIPDGARIAFCYTYNTSYWRVTIDDVVVKIAPSCFPVGTLSYDYDNVGATSADLSWTLVDNTQNAWQIDTGDVDHLIDVDLTEATKNDNTVNYTINSLHPSTVYTVKVRANCGTDPGEWSNPIAIETPIACPAPTALELEEATKNSLTVSWTEGTEGDNSWTVCYKEAEGENDFHCNTNVTENSYTIEDLTQGTNYIVKVMTNCANSYPSPEISAVFQTEASCPAPTNLEVTDGSETAHGATITWNGNADNNSYTIEYAEGPMVGLTTLLEENFDGSGMPTGWSIMGLGTSNWSVSTTDNAGGVANEMHLYYDPSFNGISRLVTPAIDLTGITEVTFSFKHNLDNYSGSHTLGIATSNDGGITWNDGWSQSYSDNTSATISQTIATPDMGNSNVIFCIYYNGYSDNINDWYFDDVTITAEYNPTYSWNELATNATSPYTINTLDPETQYVVRVKGVCDATTSPASNIVGFTTPEACARPTAFTQGTVTTHEATFSWTAGNGNESWKVYVKKHTDAEYPETYTEVTTLPTTEAPFSTGTTLVANTAYDVKIVPNCDPTKFLEVENAFTTDYENLTLPYNTSFDAANDADWRLVNSSHVNKWVIGEAAGNGDPTRGLYISNDNGTTNAYNNSGNCIVFAYAVFSNFEASKQYTVSFDWKNNGETGNYDFIRAWLVPDDAVFSANTSNELPAGMTSATGNPTDWISLDNNTPLINVTTWQTNTAYVTVPTDGAYKLVFMWRQDNSDGNNRPAAIDNVSIAESEKYTVTVNVNDIDMGSVTSTPTVLSDIYENTTVTLEATANVGYHFLNWTNNATEDVVTTNPINFKLSQDTTYTANFEINTYTITAAADPAEGGTVEGAGTYNHGSNATLTATANEGYAFVNWTLNDEEVSNNATYMISSVSADGDYVAHFVPTYVINATANPAEGGTVEGAGTYNQGSNATLTATANEGYTFVNWTKGGLAVSANPTYTINSVSEAADYVANFDVNQYTLTINYKYADGSQAAATYTESVNYNASYSVNSPDITGYTADQVTVSGTMGTADVTVDVTYAINSYTLTINYKYADGSQAAATYTESVNYNAAYSVNSPVITGYTADQLTVAGTMGAADVTVDVTYVINTYTITATANPTEGGTVEGAGTYEYNYGLTLTAIPSEGYYFVNWTKGGEEVSTSSSFSITVTENADYVAHFAAYDVYTKNIEANKWYAISTPVHTNGNNEALSMTNLTSGTYDLYGYTENEGKWVKETSSLAVGKGYIYRRANDVTLSFVGIANTGSISVNVSSSCPDNDLKGFNLIGNPDTHDITFTNSYYSLNTNGTWQAHTSGTIGVAEAFLVQTSEGGSIDIPDQLPATSNTANSALAFTVSNDEFEDVAYARFDNGEGLRKIGHLNSEAPMLSIPVEGRRYAIANLGSDCQSFNLVFRGVNGTYTIKQSSNQAIAYCHLIDRVAGKEIDMLRQPSYTFSSNGFDADRFMVKLSPDAQENANGNFAYWNGNVWMVEGNGTLQVFDALGRQLFSQEISNSNFEIHNSLFPAAGVYVLRMGEKTQKIVVR